MALIYCHEIKENKWITFHTTPTANDLWRSKQTNIQYEVICITNIPNRKEMIVSFFNHQERKAKIESIEDFKKNFALMAEFPGR